MHIYDNLQIPQGVSSKLGQAALFNWKVNLRSAPAPMSVPSRLQKRTIVFVSEQRLFNTNGSKHRKPDSGNTSKLHP